MNMQEMIEEADRDGDNEVSLAEFERIMKVLDRCSALNRVCTDPAIDLCVLLTPDDMSSAEEA